MAWQADILVEQGASFELEIDLTDADGNLLDTTGYAACSQIREHALSVNSSANFSTALATGMLTLTLTANATAALSMGRYVWDARVTDANGVVTRVVEGIVTVDPSASR